MKNILRHMISWSRGIDFCFGFGVMCFGILVGTMYNNCYIGIF